MSAFRVNLSHVLEPFSPTGLNDNGSDLDARNKTISVAWNQPSGGYAAFKVSLLDSGSVTAFSDFKVGTSADLNSENIKNGHNYTLRIETKSEPYGSPNQYENGDVFQVEIQTKVQGKNIFLEFKQSYVKGHFLIFLKVRI